MCICMHVCFYADAWQFLVLHTAGYTHTYTHDIYIHTYIHTYLHVSLNPFTETAASRVSHRKTYIHTCMHACMHACIHTFLSVLSCGYLHTHTHTSIAYIPACIIQLLHRSRSVARNRRFFIPHIIQISTYTHDIYMHTHIQAYTHTCMYHSIPS